MHKVRSLLVLALASTLIALGMVAASPGVAVGNPAPQLAPSCSAFVDPIYRVVKPKNNASLLTPWLSEVASAASSGYRRVMSRSVRDISRNCPFSTR